VRRDIANLVAMLRAIPGLRSLSLTTNGVLLGKLAGPLAEAGLTRINVSLDSLVREKFTQLTRRDALEQVLAGLEELEKYPTIHPIKINAVAMRGFTESEVLDFVALARRRGSPRGTVPEPSPRRDASAGEAADSSRRGPGVARAPGSAARDTRPGATRRARAD